MSRYRHEYKYLIDAGTEAILRIRLAGILSPDAHADADGTYYIRSLYFDDYGDSCFWENEAGTDPRSKFRIRYYNHDSSRLQLEKKSKVRGMTRKESCAITREECRCFMAGGVPTVQPEMPDIKKKLFTEMAARSLIPKVIVSYERIPLVYAGGNVRVTFDRNLTSSVDIGAFLEGNYVSRPVFSVGDRILEVKWDEVLPLHIKDVLGLPWLRWTAFSKYAMCRRYHL